MTVVLSIQQVSARVIYVSQDATGDGSGSSWGNACATITAGLAASVSGDQVWLKSATYPEATTLKEGVALYGGFLGTEAKVEEWNWYEAVTVINSSTTVSSTVTGADEARIDGFILVGSNGRWQVECRDTSPTIANCTVMADSDHRSYGVRIWKGGTLDRIGGPPSLMMLNCSIIGSAYEGVHLWYASAILIDCTLADNAGLGIHVHHSEVTATGCTFTGNLRGVEGELSRITLRNCLISGNSGNGVSTSADYDYYWNAIGSRDCTDLSPRLTNCLIADNSGYGVGGRRATPILVNCMLANNDLGDLFVLRQHFVPLEGEPYWFCDTFPSLTNCILWSDSRFNVVWEYYQEQLDPDDFSPYWEPVGEETMGPGEGVDVFHSCVSGGWPAGVGNIGTDPLFVNPNGGDYHLQNGSPCIDTATSTDAPATDLDAHVRPVDIPGVGRDGPGAYDMGAYEFQPSPPRVGSLWILRGTGEVQHLPAPTPTP